MMISGTATLAMSLLVSPAVFAAALNDFDLLGKMVPGTRTRHWACLVLWALGAYLLSAVGQTLALSLVAVAGGEPLEAVPAAPKPVLALARSLMPFSFGIFAIVSGVAGALVGEVTRRRDFQYLSALRWLACLVLIASFGFPFLVTANLIGHRGLPVASIVWCPLALPLILTGLLARWHCGGFGVPLGHQNRRMRATLAEGESLDRILSNVIEANGHDGSSLGEEAHTEAELEMAYLAASIRRVAASSATIPETRVQEIVEALVAASPLAQGSSVSRAPSRKLAVGGEFSSAWICLTAGLLVISPLGGVPANVVSAAIVGLLGSAVIVFLRSRNEIAPMTVPT